MMFRNRITDPRARKLMGFGIMELAVGLLLWLFVHPSTSSARDVVHGVSGLLLGISVVLIVQAGRLTARGRGCA